jgi:hypothetical protein
MSWREPKDPRDFMRADCATLRELAEAYHPFVRYADAERFFPALAEAWLQHASAAPWPPRRDDASALWLGQIVPPETGFDWHRRGTGVCRADDAVSHVEVLGGIPNADDRPLVLEDRPGDPDSITRYRGIDGKHFLDFAGWIADIGTEIHGRAGDVEYLSRAFSELAAAMNPSRPWEPVELMAHLPTFWIPQPPTPTVYCEARRASDFTAVSESLTEKDFPPMTSPRPLDRFLVLTYHYLYPAREASGGEPAVRVKEGQWEAVSLFFETAGEPDEELHFHEPPVAIVVSQGTDAGGPKPHATDFRRWTDVTRPKEAPTHPIVFSALGTHRFFFEATSGQPWVPGSGGAPLAPQGGSYDNNSEFPGWESVLVGGLIVAAILAAIGLWILALIVAILVILFWLLSLLLDACNDDSENPANPMPSNPEAQGDGPQGGDPAEPPAPGAGAPDGSAGGPGGTPGGSPVYGLPNTGSPTGANTVSFDVRFIDRIGRREGDDRRPRFTPYPSPEPCELPTWWDFSGRWGVRVAPGLSGTWASGDQRVDEHGRSWGYWHTLRFFEEMHLASS